MTTPFLAGFAEAVIDRLLEERLLELASTHDARDRTVLFVANWLGTRAQGASLISSLEAGLLACPEVLELYADLERLKAVVDDLR
jgi:hypothetical protein